MLLSVLQIVFSRRSYFDRVCFSISLYISLSIELSDPVSRLYSLRNEEFEKFITIKANDYKND